MPGWTFPVMAHGADYNPDQWLQYPEVLEEDVRLMQKARCNLMSVGIFAWAALEPEEGRYAFDWLRDVLDRLYRGGISVLLATPSGARPAWMSRKYPQVLRTQHDGVQNLHGGRHNHCLTSPVYRAFVARINEALVTAFGKHPAVVGFHISNEYSGDCHCALCQDAFRTFLAARHGTLAHLNEAWWTAFWAKTVSDWAELSSPGPRGETTVHGLNLDWKRFVTEQTIDFMRAEMAPIRRLAPHLPVTTNFMHKFEPLDYARFADAGVLDVASWDSYPMWGRGADDTAEALSHALWHDAMRCFLQKPFLLMESTPSVTNWQPFAKLKRPGMHLFSSLWAVAHGADSVQYFQWRKSRGAAEKFHGAVVDHVGHEHTRVFDDVRQVGEALEKLPCIVGSATPARVALIYDTENRWAIRDAAGPAQDKRHEEIVQSHYNALKAQGVDVDVIDSERDFARYHLVVAPMLYMVKPGVAKRLEAFAASGGHVVVTYWSGVVDENDLCHLGGFPGPLRRLLGVWAEEIDALWPGQTNTVVPYPGNVLGLEGTYPCDFLCELSHLEGAQALAVYGGDFYAGRPALTVNDFGKGRAWYIAAHTGEAFLTVLYNRLAALAQVPRVLDNTEPLPQGVTVCTRRGQAGERYAFVFNSAAQPRAVTLPVPMRDLLTGETLQGPLPLAPYAVHVLSVLADGAHA